MPSGNFTRLLCGRPSLENTDGRPPVEEVDEPLSPGSYCDFCRSFPYEDVGREVPLETLLIQERFSDTRFYEEIEIGRHYCQICLAVDRALLLNNPGMGYRHLSVKAVYNIRLPTRSNQPPELEIQLRSTKASYFQTFRGDHNVPYRDPRPRSSAAASRLHPVPIGVSEIFRRCFPIKYASRDDKLQNWGCVPTGCLRPVQPKVDFEMLRSWHSMCNQNGHSCQTSLHSTGFNKSILRVRMVDVRRNCLVDSSLNEPYLALSYVWGGVLSLGLHLSSKRGNVPALYKPGAFDKKPLASASNTLARTIRDAIEVTRQIGYQYLFVDRVCIDQDDDADKMAYAEAMGHIFGSASITIVAGAGNSANSGLPGVSDTPRNIPSRPTINLPDGGRLMRLYECEKRPETLLEDVLASSPWMTRAWTFQERLLSLRILIFTDQGVFWSCNQGRYSEAIAYEQSNISVDLDMMSSALSPNEEILNLSEPDAVLYNSKRLTGLVSDYKRRKLTFPSDILRAFQGVLAAFSKVNDPWPTYFGLSTRALPIELAWGIPPGESESINLLGDISTSESFPSWSWLMSKEEEVFWERELYIASSSFLKSEESMTTSMYRTTENGGLEETFVEHRPIFQLFPGQRELTADKLLAALPAHVLKEWKYTSRAIVFGGFPIPCAIVKIVNPKTRKAEPVIKVSGSGKESISLRNIVSWQQYPGFHSDLDTIKIVPLGRSASEFGTIWSRDIRKIHCLLIKEIDGVGYRVGKFACCSQYFQELWSFATFKPIVLC